MVPFVEQTLAPPSLSGVAYVRCGGGGVAVTAQGPSGVQVMVAAPPQSPVGSDLSRALATLFTSQTERGEPLEVVADALDELVATSPLDRVPATLLSLGSEGVVVLEHGGSMPYIAGHDLEFRPGYWRPEADPDELAHALGTGSRPEARLVPADVGDLVLVSAPTTPVRRGVRHDRRIRSRYQSVLAAMSQAGRPWGAGLVVLGLQGHETDAPGGVPVLRGA